jgi:hypothetical protein
LRQQERCGEKKDESNGIQSFDHVSLRVSYMQTHHETCKGEELVKQSKLLFCRISPLSSWLLAGDAAPASD